MAREKFHTLTEQMFYILLALREECCGMDVVDAICDATPVTDSNGSVAKENQPVITSIRVTEVARSK